MDKKVVEKNDTMMQFNREINSNAGVTMVALVVTIIVLLILVGVVIANLNGEGGLIAETEQIMNGYEDYQQGEKEKVSNLVTNIKKSTEKVKVILTKSTDEWTNQDVVVSVEVRNKPDGYYTYMRASESSPWQKVEEMTIRASEYTGEQTVTACIAEESNPSQINPQRHSSAVDIKNRRNI